MKMTQKILIAGIIVLILINAFLLSFIWINRPGRGDLNHGPNRKEMRERFLKERLELEEQNLSEVRERFEYHEKQMEMLSKEASLKRKLLHQYAIAQDSVKVRELIAGMDSIQHSLHVEIARFLTEISSITSPEQQQVLMRLYEQKQKRRRLRGR
jgi:Spy/CpxP family protein refolding chaperone